MVLQRLFHPIDTIPSAELPSTAPPNLPQPEPPPPPPETPAFRPKPLALLGGILLPLIALTVELVWHPCGWVFFDPIPTPFHTALLALVPVANLLLSVALATGSIGLPRALGWLAGIPMGIALPYAIVFLPGMPFWLLFAMAFVGLLPLAPLLAYCSGFSLRNTLLDACPEAEGHVLRGGLASFALLALITVPTLVTHTSLRLYRDADTQADAVRWMRWLGDRQELLKACYHPQGSMPLFGSNWETTEDARRLFYLVTGEHYTSRPRPFSHDDWNRWDSSQGTTTVGPKLQRLSLGSSRIDLAPHPDAGLAYLEWTLNFENRAGFQQEARALVELPPGSVVSRATLWIDGQEREAAFGSTQQVRAAYQSVVAARRDPLLVTYAGPNRVTVQCFPVPAQGDMRIRLGITSPAGETVALPYLAETNFEIHSATDHLIWVDGRMRPSIPAAQHHALRMAATDSAQTVAPVWTPDPVSPATHWIRQTRVERTVPAPRRLTIVADASRSLNQALPQVAKALAYLPPRTEVRLFWAGLNNGAERPVAESPARALERAEFSTGVDPVSTLATVYKEASLSTHPESEAILWIAGAQPYLYSQPEALRQMAERAAAPPEFWILPASAEPNVLIAQLSRLHRTRILPRGPAESTGWLLRRWSLGREWHLEQSRIAFADEQPPEDWPRSTSHIARLWAFGEVNRLAAAQPESAAAIAIRYSLVTSVSGAVVLETARQYRQNGLTPTDTNNAPSIPEPGTWLLIGTGITAIAVIEYRRRRSHPASDASSGLAAPPPPEVPWSDGWSNR